jgi:prepilin-type N-terminal cleavage/methylation domain-containing protein
MIARLLRRRGPSESGVTLVELLVSIALMSVVSSLVTAGIVASNRVLRNNDDESRGLADVRKVSERLGRDLRESRSVVCDGAVTDPTCQRHLQLWIDDNSDYKQQSSETITWQLQPASADPSHFNMIRSSATGTTAVEARTIVSNVAFTYDYPPGAVAPGATALHTKVVNVDITYDAVVGQSTGQRSITFSERLRNVQ